MKANRTAPQIRTLNIGCIGLIGAGLALLNGCSSTPAPAPSPAPAVETRPASPPASTPAALPRPTADWRDASITPGTWSWSSGASGAPRGSVASFGQAGMTPLAMVICDSASGTLRLARSGNASVRVAMAVTTTTGSRPLESDPAVSPPGWVATTLSPRDRVLDAIAFSRGRFMFEVAGLPSLYLPSWPEISRVIEDCR